MDLLDVWRGRLTARKAMVFVLQLPAGAQTWIDMGTDAAWTPEGHLLAYNVDLLAGGNWQRAGGKGKQPKPLDRPADIKKAMDRKRSAVEKAEKFQAAHGSPPPAPEPTTDSPRDERGRFVSRKG